MNKIEGIIYRAKSFGQHAKLEETLYLLSVIETAEKVLEEIHECGSIKQAEIVSGLALQVIRGR